MTHRSADLGSFDAISVGPHAVAVAKRIRSEPHPFGFVLLLQLKPFRLSVQVVQYVSPVQLSEVTITANRQL